MDRPEEESSQEDQTNPSVTHTLQEAYPDQDEQNDGEGTLENNQQLLNEDLQPLELEASPHRGEQGNQSKASKSRKEAQAFTNIHLDVNESLSIKAGRLVRKSFPLDAFLDRASLAKEGRATGYEGMRSDSDEQRAYYIKKQKDYMKAHPVAKRPNYVLTSSGKFKQSHFSSIDSAKSNAQNSK